MTPRLETPRLVLRPFTPGDWDAVNSMLSDPETTRYMHFAAWTADRRRAWFDWCITNGQRPQDDVFNWAVTRKESGEAIGWFGIGGADERGFGYLIARPCWNRGYMTETLLAVLAFEFGVRRTPRLRATCDVANLASARVMEKAGMRQEKTEYGADFEGNWAERHHYAITRTEHELLG